MSVLKGEGKVVILFGTSSIAARTKIHRGYIARPDLGREWPTVLLIPDGLLVTSSVRDISRRLARQGLAVVAPELGERSAADLDDIVEFVSNPAGSWSSAGRGYGLLALGSGAELAVAAAAKRGVLALALAYPAEDGLTGISAVTAPVLGLLPRGEEGSIGSVRSAAPHAELVVYDGVSRGFLDDSGDAFDQPAFSDALERISVFFEKHLAVTLRA
ncbi:MAG TPA: dienelactone hydrolase family protein [Acidimicrobiia bacterium]|jgi:dienelactone hydrolase